MKNFRLYYLADPPLGGWVTFTFYLWKQLIALGHRVSLEKIASRVEKHGRAFYGHLHYWNNSLECALAILKQQSKDECVIFTAVGPKHWDQFVRLAQACEGRKILVIHDPTELKVPEVRMAIMESKVEVLVIRPIMRTFVKDALGIEPIFMPHPYTPGGIGGLSRTGRSGAISLSRIDWDKGTHLIVEANTMLEPRFQVRIFGSLNSQYAFHKIEDKWPTWKRFYHGSLPKDPLAALRAAARANYCVDMSAIAGDGGGTQYTFLEAWDAGACLVLHEKWFNGVPEDRWQLTPGKDCMVVSGSEALAVQLTRPVPMQVIENAFLGLEPHFKAAEILLQT